MTKVEIDSNEQYTSDEDKHYNDVEDEQDDDEYENDLITLHSCGITTRWKFPKYNKHCPVPTCLKKFGVRSDAIAHYKKKHANYSILCSICDKPICSKSISYFKKHYNCKHPNAEIPFGLGRKLNPNVRSRSKSLCHSLNSNLSNSNRLKSFQQVKEVQKNGQNRAVFFKRENIESEDEQLQGQNEDDLITLHSCGITTQWKFPKNIKICPVITCRKNFDSRSNAIAHYKRTHANHSILCSICDKPLYSKSISDFIRHHKNIHPDVEIPYGLTTKLSSNVRLMRFMKMIFIKMHIYLILHN